MTRAKGTGGKTRTKGTGAPGAKGADGVPGPKGAGGMPPIFEAIAEIHSLSDTVWTACVDLGGSDATTSIVFTATEADSGTTLIAASCGMGIAANKRTDVLLVEANLRRPALAAYFGIATTRGLSDLLAGRATLDEVCYRVPACPGLTLIPAGEAREALPGEFTGEHVRETMSTIARRCRYVFFDTPPVLRHSETRALLRHAGYAVLVVRAGESGKTDVRRACELIESTGVEFLGTVLNGYKSDLPFDSAD